MLRSLAKLENADPKIEPDLQSLTVLKPADLICHLWERYTATALIPLAGSAAALRREMNTFNGHNIVRMEGRVNSVIQKALDSAFTTYRSDWADDTLQASSHGCEHS